jgi:hypothetical protein
LPQSLLAFEPGADRLNIGLMSSHYGLGLCLAVLAVGHGFPGVTVGASAASTVAERQTIPLSGGWDFQRDGAKPEAWKSVAVPSTFQEHEGNNFHGVGWYRREVPAFNASGRRVLLHFEAAATVAEVWWDGQKLGTHLGGWTPFRFDVTDLIRRSAPGQRHEVRVRLDEKVGHNTQGFLPIIEPHWGGLWQDVQLVLVPETYLNDLQLLARGNPQTARLELEAPLAGTVPKGPIQVLIRHRLAGTGAWRTNSFIVAATNLVRMEVPVESPALWSPDSPRLYDVELALLDGAGGGDRVAARAAFRTIEAWGDHLRLNGQPLSVRGVLNWGFYPPRLAPHPDEARFRKDLEFARASGFNLMKFCLWVPPRRYLELCDELGCLAWMEYPTWHPDLTPQHLGDLRQEFIEFFRHDRNHPSVILRSLTCETGSGADLEVIRALYELAHRHIPGAVIEDDSSWIGWNRIHDFYDDHPYGNNHTWVKTLEGFREYILAHGPKPLVLGESIAADTWFHRQLLLDQLGTNRPYWLAGFFDAMPAWQARLARTVGPGGFDQLAPDSLSYAMLMRKYQIETFRREIPYGGYVVTVLRDFSLAAMGLLDFQDRPKWAPPEWAWQGDTMCLLKTENDRRSFFAGESFRAEVLLSHFAPERLDASELTIDLAGAGPASGQRVSRRDLRQNPGTLAHILKTEFPLPSPSTPQRLLVTASLKTARGVVTNHWPIWVVPRSAPDWTRRVWLHGSVPQAVAHEAFSGAARGGQPEPGQVVVASRFDDSLVELIEHGARVLLLPDGRKGSFPLAAHWFLRGAPFVPDHPVTREAPRAFWVELQHFDLAADVIPEPGYLDMTDPILLLWDNHDLKTVKTHGLAFETCAGQGRCLVSALRHTGPSNAAGQWLLSVLVDRLATGPVAKNALSDPAWKHLKEKLHEEKVDLTKMVWRFKPDPRAEGADQNWAAQALDNTWKDIRVGLAWEGQGYPNLDGWAWYRLATKIPETWKGRPVYLTFEGVDDMYELYLDGKFVAKRGDLATRKDTFNEKFSHDLTALVKPGQECVIAVRVYDWYGAGGIFRPVTLSTCGFSEEANLLK